MLEETNRVTIIKPITTIIIRVKATIIVISASPQPILILAPYTNQHQTANMPSSGLGNALGEGKELGSLTFILGEGIWGVALTRVFYFLYRSLFKLLC